MNILGVSCYHHDSAAANIKDNRILGASQEERFSRVKYDRKFPINTINWLKNAYEDFDYAVFYEKETYKRFKRDIKFVSKAKPVLVDHHEAHAMSSILTTDWTECAIMVVDTVGNRYSTSLGVYKNGQIEWIKRFRYPNSIGLFYSSATRLLGFVPLSDECKVMSAAAHGTPKWASWINQKVVDYNADGDYTFLHNLERGVGTGTLDWDIAASVQQVTQNILLSLAIWLQKETGLTKLAYAGGVALNCVANTYLLKHSEFNNIAIQPAAGDAGCALGAAALITRPLWENAYLGVHSSSINIHADECADRIIKGEIVPVIQGRAEFGPRALGNRSLLCAPTDDNIKKLNRIKMRDTDYWRPYAPVCQIEEADKYFKVYQHSKEMLFIADIIGGNFKTHDNTARLQTVTGSSNAYLWKVLEKTRQYGYPILINTSLNAKGKPIVNSLDDFKREVRLHD